MRSGQVPSLTPVRPRVTRQCSLHRFTILDFMILTAAIAIGCWTGLQQLVWSINTVQQGPLSSLEVRIFLVRTVPFASSITIALLFLRLVRLHSSASRLAREPGFVACLAASMVLLVGGSMTFSGVSRNTSAPWRGLFFSDYFVYLLQPFERAEVGFAVVASWLLITVGGRWRSEPTWIDRCGRALGVYWIMLIPVIRLGGVLRL
jgi:hypothetical protein